MKFPTSHLDQSVLRVVGGIFHFCPNFNRKQYVSKQWKPWSDAASVASDLGLHCLPVS